MLKYAIVSPEEVLPFTHDMVETFKHLAKEENYKWEWENNPEGSLQVLVYYQGRPIGHFGFLGIKFFISGRLVLGAKAEGAFLKKEFRGKFVNKVHPEIGDRRVFPELVAHALTEASKRYEFIFGFPNEAAVKGEVKGGFDLWNIPIRQYVKVLSYGRFITKQITKKIPVVGRRLGQQLLEKSFHNILKVRSRIPTSDDLDVIAQIHNESGLNRICYTRAYLQWRILDNPHNFNSVFVLRDSSNNRARGYVIYTFKLTGGLKGLIINDIKASSEDIDNQFYIYRDLIMGIMEMGKQFHPDYIITWWNLNKFPKIRDEVFMRLGFRPLDTQKKCIVKAPGFSDLFCEDFDINNMWTEGT